VTLFSLLSSLACVIYGVVREKKQRKKRAHRPKARRRENNYGSVFNKSVSTVSHGHPCDKFFLLSQRGPGRRKSTQSRVVLVRALRAKKK
jgi:hypothetical protein